MLEIDFSVVIQIINFLLLLLLLNFLLFKPIRGIMAQRDQKTRSLQEEIDDYKNRSERNQKGIDEGKIEAGKEGFMEKEKEKGLGLEKEKGLLGEANDIAEKTMDKAKQELEIKINEVRRALKDQTSVFSRELSEKILGRTL